MQYKHEPLDLQLSLVSINSVQNKNNLVKFQYAVVEMSKKGDFENPKVPHRILVLNQSPISAVFPIVWFAGDQKTALTGGSL